MDNIYKILSEIRPEFDFHENQDYITNGMLDSFDVISLVTDLEGEFCIKIDGMDIVPDNFKSAATIAGLIIKSGGVIK